MEAQNAIHKFQKSFPFIVTPSDLHPDQLNAEVLKMFIILLKRKGDEALPKLIQDLKVRWGKLRDIREHTNKEHLLHQVF